MKWVRVVTCYSSMHINQWTAKSLMDETETDTEVGGGMKIDSASYTSSIFFFQIIKVLIHFYLLKSIVIYKLISQKKAIRVKKKMFGTRWYLWKSSQSEFELWKEPWDGKRAVEREFQIQNNQTTFQDGRFHHLALQIHRHMWKSNDRKRFRASDTHALPSTLGKAESVTIHKAPVPSKAVHNHKHWFPPSPKGHCCSRRADFREAQQGPAL